LLEEVKGDNDSKKRAQQELEKLKANIALREDELKSLKPEVRKYSIYQIFNIFNLIYV